MTRPKSKDLIISRRDSSGNTNPVGPEVRPYLNNDPLWLRLQAFLSLKAERTRITYTGILQEWCRFLGAELGTPEASKRFIQAQDLHAIAYKAWLEKQPGETPRFRKSSSKSREVELTDSSRRRSARDGLQETLGNATIAKKFAALRRMYRVVIAANMGISTNPFETDRVPPPPKESGRKRPTEMVDFKLVKRVCNLPDKNIPRGLRDRAVLAMLFGGGLRRSEVCTLRLGDVRKSAQGRTFLYLRATKAKKDARQALPDWAANSIWELVRHRKKLKAEDGDYLVVSFTGKGGNVESRRPVSGSGIYALFKHYCKEAGVENIVTPHSARATAITRLLDQGLSHREVQEFSRHASVTMVEAYDKRRIGVDENPAKDLDY